MQGKKSVSGDWRGKSKVFAHGPHVTGSAASERGASAGKITIRGRSGDHRQELPIEKSRKTTKGYTDTAKAVLPELGRRDIRQEGEKESLRGRQSIKKRGPDTRHAGVRK